MKELLYLGTYTEQGEGIYVATLDRSDYSCKIIQVVPSKDSPSFLAIHPNKKNLYASNEGNATISAYTIDQQTGALTLLNNVPSKGKAPCHLSIDPTGQLIFISNYVGGNLTVYRLKPDGSIGDLTDHIQNEGHKDQKPHMHSIIVSPNGQYAYCSDLGIDTIFIYQINLESGKLIPATMPAVTVTSGDGPRHFLIHPNGKYGYSLGELNGVINTFSIESFSGKLSHLQRISMLPSDFKDFNAAADLHFSPDGKYLYASNRGHDSLAIYQVDPESGLISLIGHEATRGKHPRNFLIDKLDKFVIVTNRDDNNVVFFDRNVTNGTLQYAHSQFKIPTPVCVLQLFLGTSS